MSFAIKNLHLLIIFLGIITIFGTLKTFALERQENLSDLDYFDGKIAKVVDGDTVHVLSADNEKAKIRMAGIDAPESNFNNRSQGTCAKMAANYLAQLLPINTKVRVYFSNPKYDSYGRVLGYVVKKKSNLDINYEMVRAGYATAYYIYPNTTNMFKYLAAMRNAVSKQIGVYNPSAQMNNFPFEFRLIIGDNDPSRYVGNIETNKLYPPKEYKKVPSYLRLFFDNEDDALSEGFSR
ncbi:MAG: thermonuclease family protein [Oligoflexia bacterium]|nr:thermonuclease family protein [Oligoflexia bacterium]